MLCAIFFEIFLCLPFLLSALLVFTLRSHDPDSENSAARVYDKFSYIILSSLLWKVDSSFKFLTNESQLGLF